MASGCNQPSLFAFKGTHPKGLQLNVGTWLPLIVSWCLCNPLCALLNWVVANFTLPAVFYNFMVTQVNTQTFSLYVIMFTGHQYLAAAATHDIPLCV